MSNNKVTRETLKKLVEGLLNEDTFPFKLPDENAGTKKKFFVDRKADFDKNTSAWRKMNVLNNASAKDNANAFNDYFPIKDMKDIDKDDFVLLHTNDGLPKASGNDLLNSYFRIAFFKQYMTPADYAKRIKYLTEPTEEVTDVGKMPKYWTDNFKQVPENFNRDVYGTRLAQIFTGVDNNVAQNINKNFGTAFVKKPVDPATITNPETFSDLGVSAQSLSSATPGVSESEKYLMDSFFKVVGDPGTHDAANVIKRFEKISEFSKLLYENEDITNFVDPNDKAGFMTYVLMMQYLNKMVRESVNESTSYEFEAFCAFIAGGRKSGVESGAAGGQGEADFFLGDGSKGSAKYYAGKSIGQSIKNFQLNAPVLYIVVQKKGFNGNRLSSSNSSLIQSLDIHMFFVEKTLQDSDDTITTYAVDDTSKKDKGWAQMAGTSWKFNEAINDSTKVATLYLAKSSDETIRENLANLEENTQKAFGSVLDIVRKIFQSLTSSKDKVMKYSTTADFDTGILAMQQMNEAKESLVSLGQEFGNQNLSPQPSQNPQRQTSAQPIRSRRGSKKKNKKQLYGDYMEESKKITASMLRKIIEENFKK